MPTLECDRQEVFEAAVKLAKYCASFEDCEECLFYSGQCSFNSPPADFNVPAKFVNGYQESVKMEG